jgi:thymidylate kinase
VNCISVVIEGADQVGKGDTTHNLLEVLMSYSIPVFRLSFPQYATPFGSAIRLFLKNGVDNIYSLSHINGTRREIEIRMMMFALDRLQALESILRRTNVENSVLLLDRGPYSNALTIAYGMSVVDAITDHDISEMAKLGFEMEKYLINSLDLDKCVIQLTATHGKEGWSSLRGGEEDQYEKREIQENADKAYKEFSKLVGKGWRNIITKENGTWKKRDIRDKEILACLEELVDLSKLESTQKGKYEAIDVIDVAKDMYGLDISDSKDVKEFYKALEKNEKNLIYNKGHKIGKYIAKECKSIKIEDKGVKKSMYNIVEAYPECLVLLEDYYGKDFVNKVKDAIYD